MNNTNKLYLASRSPRRVELLKQIGVDCTILPADINESELPNEDAVSYVQRLAREKAQVVLQQLRRHDTAILAADTTVVFNNHILGKPRDDNNAYHMLHMLAGSSHWVHTAVTLAYDGRIETLLSSTLVEMMPLTQAQITAYIHRGEHHDKAGSYGIQGTAGGWIKRIEGSYTGVMGLPLFETAQLLRKNGILTL